MNTFNADGRWVQCAFHDCFTWVDSRSELPVKSMLMSVPTIPVPAEMVWYACEQHREQVKNAQFDVKLAFQKPLQTNTRYLADELKILLGHIYRKPLEATEQAIETGIMRWAKNLTEKQEDENGAKLEVALLNALTRLGIPTFFAGSAACGGPETPAYDLVALGFFNYHSPTAVLIDCKNTKKLPSLWDIGKLSDEVHRVRKLLPSWLVFGVLAYTGEPIADEFGYRNDIRIWKQSHLQAILNAHAREQVDQLLWTHPHHWNATSERLWRSLYDAFSRNP